MSDSLSIRIQCGDTEDALNLLKLLIRNADDCTPWVNCDNASDSLESIAKRLIGETPEGELALRVCGCDVQASIDEGIKRGTDDLTADVETTITFDSAFSSTAYVLLVNCRDANGDEVGSNVTDRVAGSFKVTASADCTINYIAMLI